MYLKCKISVGMIENGCKNDNNISGFDDDTLYSIIVNESIKLKIYLRSGFEVF